MLYDQEQDQDQATELDPGPAVDIPHIQTYGEAYRLHLLTDSRGAVLVAYTRDNAGAVTRSQIRIDLEGADYIRRRLDGV